MRIIKQSVKWIMFAFMFIMGVLMLTDVTLVWLGYKTVIHSEYFPDYYNSKIWGYNVSWASNTLMAMMSGMSLYCSWFIVKFIK